MRLADCSTVRSIDWTRSGIAGTGNLSPRSRRTLAIYIVLAKFGFDGIHSPLGAIADAVSRAGSGAGGSIRTLQRAHCELCDRGFIRLAENRGDHRASTIFFNLDAFSYWTGRKTEKMVPISHNVASRDTLCDNILHTPNCQPSDRSRINPRVNYQNNSQECKEQRAGARANNRHRRNAVVFSLLRVLESGNLHPRDRRRARARAEVETRAAAAGVELLNPSGVDWNYWAKRWDEMPISVREVVMKSEILPHLIDQKVAGKVDTARIFNAAPEACNDFVEQPPEQLGREEIRSLCRDLESRFEIAPGRRPSGSERQSPREYPKIDLQDPDMALLLEARNRTRARAVNGR